MAREAVASAASPEEVEVSLAVMEM